MPSSFKVAGLFAGIGGIELGFQRAMPDRLETALLCESWDSAQAVLRRRFPDVDLHGDVATLRSLPADLDLIAAGFPCTDLSQAGRTAGIRGAQSGLVGHLFDILRGVRKGGRAPWLLIENVPNMLTLDGGEAMSYLVKELEELGYSWAYRVVDSRFTGIPQRRRRVLLLASRVEDPRTVLYSEDSGPLDENRLRDDAFGFYWTEGRTGLGWARDATPTFKGGSSLGIPSPPAVWLPNYGTAPRMVLPCVEDGEALQGFPRGWTEPADIGRRNGPRWKLVGNAVTVGVAQWLASRLLEPRQFERASQPWSRRRAWPAAAWGHKGKIWQVEISEFPRHDRYVHLLDLLDLDKGRPLSHRAANGFWNRLQFTNLGRYPGFRDEMARYVQISRDQELLSANANA